MATDLRLRVDSEGVWKTPFFIMEIMDGSYEVLFSYVLPRT